MEESKTWLIQIYGNAVAEDKIADIESEKKDDKHENALDENEDFKVTLSTTVRKNVRGFLESFVLISKTENLNDTSKEESVNPEHKAELQISRDSSCNFNALKVNDENVDKGEVNNSKQTDGDNKPGVSKDRTTIIEDIIIEKTYKTSNIAEITHGKHDIAENDTELRFRYESTSETNIESRVLSSYTENDGSDNGCRIAEIEHAKGNSQKDSRDEADKTKSSERSVRNTNDTGNEADFSDIVSKGEMAEHERDDTLATRNELTNINVGNDGSGYENTKDIFQGDNKFQHASISNKISTHGKIGPQSNKECSLRTDYNDITREENCVCCNEGSVRIFQDDYNAQNGQQESSYGDKYDGNKDNSCSRSKHTHTFSQTASNTVLEHFDMQSVQKREVSKSNCNKRQSSSNSYIVVPMQRQLHNEVENYLENEPAEKGYPKPALETAALNSHSSHEDLFQRTLQYNSNERYKSASVLAGHKDLIDINYEESNGINTASRTDKTITKCSQQRNTNQTFVNSQEVEDKESHSISCFNFDGDDTNIHLAKEFEMRNM
ncbi:hypothetical protein CHS0354_010505 [Potamilus streckersoni]|uniref:Uncharacterized protein n=1 Tax=Potamilus streckersoni TaxID=2493646 RepID=A0AAE0S5T4_9BIVA|nr:hypothetical protein CHS0354_010505 [Potamilus streckersoni]